MATTVEALGLFACYARVWTPYGILLCLLAWVLNLLREWWGVRQALKPLPGPPDAVPFWTMLKMYRSRRAVITQKTAGTGEYPQRHRMNRRTVPKEEILSYRPNTHLSLGSDSYISVYEKASLSNGCFEFSYLLRALCEMYKDRTFKAYIGFSPSWLYKTPKTQSAGNVWRFKRKLQMPAFHSKTLEKFMGVVNEHADSMVERLEEASIKKELAPIQEIVKRCSLDLISEVLMGVNLNTQKNQNSQYGEYISGVTFLMAVRAFRPWMWLNSIYNFSIEGMWFRKMISGINEFNLKIMGERKKTFHLYRNQGDLSGSDDEDAKDKREHQPERRMAVIDIMLDKHFKDPSYTMQEISKDLDLLLFAGHDTTSIAMAWTLYLLGLHPELQRKVQEELDAIFMDDVNRDVTRDDTDHMVFLEACFKEAMRLFPPIPLIGRVLDESIKLGQRFAYRQAKVVLAKVLLRYTFKASWPLDRLKLSTEMVTKVKGGLRVWVRHRKPGQYA
ncbi:hypothetical protein HPB50_003664 [Hyalomma asiaticum]|uniref:Uncharacterized protein n=1 Tax=Hyalomma asiaticum TaxID=266040 RepID=A0ACB7TI43_HYAAI|nr:hypothetical protein HPB50_003664 [Hyalomma asiaticum]